MGDGMREPWREFWVREGRKKKREKQDFI